MHGEADACPSLVCDRYDRWLVVQLLSAGLEAFRAPIVDALRDVLSPDGILARHDVPVRKKEGLAAGVELLAGDVPHEVEVNEHGVRYLAAPWTGQKTGAFLDQRENRVMIGERARGRALDCFSYHGSFALHLARRADSVVAVDVSGDALKRAQENAARNDLTNIRFVEADVFDYLREVERSRERFDTIVRRPAGVRQDARLRPRRAPRIQGREPSRTARPRAGRTAVHGELQLPRGTRRVLRDAPVGGGGLGAARGAARHHRAADRPSGSA